ncbi:hypothetical protein [Paenibacillus daejeonensis]|nr:hypothetical protein [Paenibacillus daejeonensis]
MRSSTSIMLPVYYSTDPRVLGAVSCKWWRVNDKRRMVDREQ